MTAHGKLLEAIANQRPLIEVVRLYAGYVIHMQAGNKVWAARVLGINRRTIQRWYLGDSGSASAGGAS